MRTYLIFALTFLGSSVFGQSPGYFKMEGKVTDTLTGEAVAYASIGIPGHPVGTSTNLLGEFSFSIPIALHGKELRISCVGYENFTMAALPGSIEIRLKQGKTVLKEVLVTGRDLRADKLVKKAFARIKRNYQTKPFVYKAFYRHYCKDDSVYGRLIEAAVDIYKRKGHRWQAPQPGVKEEVRVTQLRRSFDSTRVSNGHMPIALYSAMGTDPVSYQSSGSTMDLLGLFAYNVSSLRHHLKHYSFELDGLTEFDGDEVYRITYRSKKDSTALNSGILLRQREEGILYIDAKSMAIVKSEWNRFSFDTVRAVTTYRKMGGKYYWHHSSKEGSSFNSSARFKHTYHLDIMANEVVIDSFEKFRGREPSREQLQEIKYDSTFWKNYTILKSTPLEEKIVSDLGGNNSLVKQFEKFDSLEKKNFSAERMGEKEFERFRELSKDTRILYLDFWASWCAPCIQEMVSEKRLLQKYKDKISFVLLSIDRDEKAWKNAISKYKLALPGFHHYRIGPDADLLKFFEVGTIPRYLLIKKNGEFYDLNAKRPSDPRLEQDFEILMNEAGVKN